VNAPTDQQPTTQRPRGQGLARRVWHNLPVVAVACLSIAVIAGVAVLPLRTWVHQRELTTETETELRDLESLVAELEANYQRLQTDEEIERLGRENFDLVFPGEESYRILPAPDAD
jgi:hypothetical protein